MRLRSSWTQRTTGKITGRELFPSCVPVTAPAVPWSQHRWVLALLFRFALLRCQCTHTWRRTVWVCWENASTAEGAEAAVGQGTIHVSSASLALSAI
jgi:hypothetical protein